MNTQASAPGILQRLHQGAIAGLHGWWRLLHFAVLMLSMALTPSSYGRKQRPILARHLVADTVSNLAWFGVLSALVSLVLIRIVVVTSQSYGLSRFALEMVVRVLVLELIPLCAAAFVALRTTLPAGLELAQRRQAASAASNGELHREFFPRVAAGVFAVWMLAAVSCVLTLVLAYLSLYGFTPWALAGYTRVVGQVFNPAVTLILVLKIVFFSFAVGLIPMATSNRISHDLGDMVRVFGMMLLIEITSLMGNYY
ncbi:MAG TPA: ABC transporter permease [Duganella sp.]|nr:ABC transporter permease [Duganella sp.]